jgi:hypothetical protein
MGHLESLRAVNRRNFQILWQSPAAEISGAFGDLGTFLPITLALARHGSINLSSTLVTSGIFNIITGAIFGIPLPVQPMKAIAASTLSSPFLPHSTPLLSGLLVGTTLLFLSATNLLHLLAKLTPQPLIRGIQLATGLQLILSANPLLTPLSPYILLTLPVLLLPLASPRFPSALVLITVSVLLMLPGHIPRISPWTPTSTSPLEGLPFTFRPAVEMAVSQLPLTLLNSILAVSSLAEGLLPDVPAPSTTALGVSVGIMNVCVGWVSGMPVCHGAGGLAAQWKFGARSGASVMVLGLVKVVLGWMFGDGLRGLLEAFPGTVLGVLVVLAGVELGRCGIVGVEGEEGMVVMMMTAAGTLALRNAAGGFVVGVVWHAGYKAAAWWKRRERQAGESRALLG